MKERKIIKALPSSFVKSCMKLASDRGAGEAKLWVGQMSNSDELDAFFAFEDGYTYSFDKANMLEYLDKVKLEYVYQKFNNYKDVSAKSWNENYNKVNDLSEGDFKVNLRKFTDASRYYVRADEDIFKETFRSIAIPKLTNVIFEKDDETKTMSILLELNLEFDSEDNTDENIAFADVLDHNLYGIHMKELNDALAEDRPHICIGWSALGDLSSISTREELDKKYSDVWPDKKNKAKGQDVGQLWRFINDVQKGDYVIFADGNVCHIGRIISDYYYDNTKYENQSDDYVNVRNVEWLKKDVPRSELSTVLHHSLATAMSIWAMNDYRASVFDLLSGTYVKDENSDEQTNGKIEIVYHTGLKNKFPRNRIIFGAPGTGKSYQINQERKILLGENNEDDYERVTFHPDYSYANFVGTYKPVPDVDSNGKEIITYRYVPGPFMRVYVDALKNGRTDDIKPFLLIIEEINRANVAAVFGDVFQLLDRDDDEVSEYSIQASEDIKNYLASELGGEPNDYKKIKIPDNMFIWATMNSADQGVFPMDTAFKRRWDFTYIGIDDNDKDIQGKYVILGSNTSQKVEWNKLRKAINHFLTKQKINEDKQLGPYFISRKIVVPESGNEIGSKAFAETFKNKVLMYLFEDAAKQKRPTLFEGCFANSSRYSEICKEFDEKGLGIFSHDISLESEPEDLTIEGATVTTTTENAEQ